MNFTVSATLIAAAMLLAGCAGNPESDSTDAQPASAQMYANPSTRPSILRTDAPHGQYNNPLDQPSASSE